MFLGVGEGAELGEGGVALAVSENENVLLLHLDRPRPLLLYQIATRRGRGGRARAGGRSAGQVNAEGQIKADTAVSPTWVGGRLSLASLD